MGAGQTIAAAPEMVAVTTAASSPRPQEFIQKGINKVKEFSINDVTQRSQTQMMRSELHHARGENVAREIS